MGKNDHPLSFSEDFRLSWQTRGDAGYWCSFFNPRMPGKGAARWDSASSVSILPELGSKCRSHYSSVVAPDSNLERRPKKIGLLVNRSGCTGGAGGESPAVCLFSNRRPNSVGRFEDIDFMAGSAANKLLNKY